MIYLVRGSTGEYSDRTEWTTKAFGSKAMAVDFINFLERKVLELGLKYVRANCYSIGWEDRMKLELQMQVHDPKFQTDYTGTQYWLEEVEYVP